MKRLFLALVACAATAQAELSTKQFALARNWAERQGCVYHGIDEIFNVKCYVFLGSHVSASSPNYGKPGFPQRGFAIAPISCNTAGEAINALLASGTAYLAGHALGTLDAAIHYKEAQRQQQAQEW